MFNEFSSPFCTKKPLDFIDAMIDLLKKIRKKFKVFEFGIKSLHARHCSKKIIFNVLIKWIWNKNVTTDSIIRRHLRIQIIATYYCQTQLRWILKFWNWKIILSMFAFCGQWLAKSDICALLITSLKRWKSTRELTVSLKR